MLVFVSLGSILGHSTLSFSSPLQVIWPINPFQSAPGSELVMLLVVLSCWCLCLSSRLLISLVHLLLFAWFLRARVSGGTRLRVDLHCHGVAVGRLLVGLGLPRPALLGFGRSDWFVRHMLCEVKFRKKKPGASIQQLSSFQQQLQHEPNARVPALVSCLLPAANCS